MRSVCALLVAVVVGLAGCGGSGGGPLSISPESVTLAPGGEVTFGARCPADTGDSSYSWGGGGGGFLDADYGPTATYTAGSVEGTYEVHVTNYYAPGYVAAARITFSRGDW